VLGIYILAVLGPGVALLWLGLRSVQRQGEAVAVLGTGNLRLTASDLAARLERELQAAARECLRDGEFASIGWGADSGFSGDELQRFQTAWRGLKLRHPIAAHCFVWRGDALIYPVLRGHLASQGPDDALAGAPPAVRRGWHESRAQAERHERGEDRLDLAAQLFEQMTTLEVPATLKAWSLSRRAACLAKAGDVAEAERAYLALLEGHADRYTASGRAYGAIAALALADLEHPSMPARLAVENAFRLLVEGHWGHSADVVEFIRRALRERGSSEPTGPAARAYLEHFGIAHGLTASGFTPVVRAEADRLEQATVEANGVPHQLFYARSRADIQPALLLGFAVDLPQVRRLFELGISSAEPGLAARFELVETNLPAAVDSPPYLDVRAAFPSVLPFWHVRALARSGVAWRDSLWIGGATGVVALVLVLGVVLLWRDVTREAAVTQLRADLVSGVSHELKTPLTLIRLYGETLLHGGPFSDQEREHFCRIITRESERLSHLITKVLDFSQVERGQRRYELEVGDLGAAIADAVQPYAQSLRRQGFTVHTALAASLPPVRFDGEAISEAALNLVENAAKYSADSKLIEIRLWAEGTAVHFEVEDHGVGITADDQSRLFQQFFRGVQPKAIGGYGIGLFLVKHIMDAHQGRIGVVSAVGQGSRFRLSFPIAAAPQPA
jgi:signal transduction histidine kinase